MFQNLLSGLDDAVQPQIMRDVLSLLSTVLDTDVAALVSAGTTQSGIAEGSGTRDEGTPSGVPTVCKPSTSLSSQTPFSPMTTFTYSYAHEKWV